tara:strand:+ start:346 stop:1095 length:750 start_codon:yes stop_codon:yes gene_type:complete
MSYYDRYSWYRPIQATPSQYQGRPYSPPQQQQGQQQQGGMNMGDMYNAYQKYNASMTPTYTSSAGNPMVNGANYSSTAQMSPVAGGDPFTSSSLSQTPGSYSFGQQGALGGQQGALGGQQGALTQGGGQGSSWMASAGPWAALAAAIAWNEDNSRQHGRRADSRGERAQDMFTGKSLELDADYYGDKVGGVGGDTIRFGGRMGNPEGSFNQMKDWTNKSNDFAKDSTQKTLDFTKDATMKPLKWLGGLF